MTYFQVGSLAIPAVWIAVVGALFVASLFNWAVMGKKVEDWYWNGFFYYFVSWKLSYIVFNFNLFLDMPMSVLYFNGGEKGHALALVILSIYLLVALKRFPFLYEESSRLFLLYFISYQVIVGFLEKSSLEMFIHLVLLFGFLLLLQKMKKILISSQMFLLFVFLELLIISLFNSFFSLESLTIIWMGSIVFILGMKADKGA
ncbi:hypothetical protein D4T97_001090 [Siminovitchia acidinfaciens]|uniref:Uncharacterized protein n=1 Tax=Siminovitchia acidinfaciens TaxID=2321395 RepID=A0A429Y731_9BACI|nr:hypothetical protein [Siminovitchia acidinfaciens]RST77124.1 hypothetical protein D4T97_001090 [Siminovitchia acidinfaciens]